MPEQFKAAGFSNGVAIWRDLLGPVDYENTVRALPTETRRLVEQPPLATSWLPAEVAYGFSYTVARLFGDRGLALSERQAVLSVERDVRGVYRPLLSLVSVDFAMRRAGALYEQYTQEAGRMIVQRTAKTSVTCRYVELPCVDQVRAMVLGGAPLGVLRVIGVKHPLVVERKLGQSTIDIVIRWGEA